MTVLWDLRVGMLFPGVLYHDIKEKKRRKNPLIILSLFL